MKNKFFIAGIFLFSAYFLAPNFSYASTIIIETDSLNHDIGDIVRFDVSIDTESSLINAVDTYITFNPKKLQFFDISDSNSVINFWVEKKALSNTVNLSGIVPGGYVGEKGKLVSLYFKTLSEGKTSLDSTNSFIFLNDGEGTKEKVMNNSLEIIVSNKISTEVKKINTFVNDFYPPESFSPEISRSSSLFDNKWFLAFSTQDKDSGISHYLIKEARYKPFLFFKKWANSTSPYVLKDQSKSSFIAIKAVDKAGNETIEKLHPENSRPLIEQIIIGLLFAGAVILFVFILHKIFKKLSLLGEE